ncbi:MAG: type VI secretion system tube protein TssD, partial [Acidobacteriota bacterium]
MPALVLAAVFSATDAGAPLNSYLTLDGQTQGSIPGDVTQLGKEGTIQVTEIHHLMNVPVDPTTGQPAGPLTHQPFVFTKQVDKATVPMYTALLNQELLTATFRYYKLSQFGTEVQYFTIALINARIIAIEPIKAETKDPTNQSFPDMERIRMVYGRIDIIN